ncbi:tRNA-dihydrouridine synthase family protein [Pigmentibacter sp. JX0631]|uniref:tRNA-dihydrouridine synthase family protein n=1 Tax=Pigmentibacter sp. JX0631 TaxID=2976982 RepID=UPI00246901C9|nr:tRNA-dihydrouridine synthase family protein [Pigmentibacter sp. JX0631]WGL60358.1 tRNA-dihydrouridine synthase family protein [Pigmentibacter sp. JX0631]
MPNHLTNSTYRNIQIGLAPMEGVTCIATRLWFSVVSRPAFAMTPFLRVTKDYPWKRVPSTYAAEIFDLKDVVPYSLIPQLMGNSPEDLERIASPLLQVTSFVDINCGCPSPKVVGSHAGSSLLQTPEIFDKFTKELEDRIGANRFSIKMRSGFHQHSEFPQLLEVIAARRLAQLTLHARTRAEKYTSHSRWELVSLSTKVCSFPVVGSGDVLDLESFQNFYQQCHDVRKLIIGRGALRNPWIFQELSSGKKVTVTFGVLSLALASYAVMQDFFQKDPERFLSEAKNGLFSETCFNDFSAWEQYYAKLVIAYYGSFIPPQDIVIDRQSFAKVKMIWNSLRSGLGEPFLQPQLLRTTSFSDFYQQLNCLFLTQEETILLRHWPEFDWMYSGEKKDGK